MTTELVKAQDSWKRVSSDAARISDELHSGQEHSSSLERSKKSLEHQVRELQAKFDGTDTLRMRTDTLVIQKLETRVRCFNFTSRILAFHNILQRSVLGVS